MAYRIDKPASWLRKSIIAAAYLGAAGVIAGILVTDINRYNTLGTFHVANEISGITLLVAGLMLIVVSSFTVRKWFPE